MERLLKLKMELVLVRDGHFSLAELQSRPCDDVVGYFTLLQREKEAQAEQEELWLQEMKTRR